jgi:DUF4097 and DUF4098 domain-containing protein YvlB
MKTLTHHCPVRALFALSGIAALALASTAWGGEEIQRTLEMPADGLVVVENLAGTVEFTGWDRNQVEVRGEAGDSVEEVEIKSTSKGVHVRIVNHKNQRHIDGTELFLHLPATASVEAESVSADISVHGMHGGSINLQTVSGDLEVEAAPQRIELQSVSGDVDFEGDTRRSSFESVSGDIEVVGAAGEVSAKTVSGNVSLEGGELAQGRFEAVSGDLDLTLAVADDGRVTCDSMSGDINLDLPAKQQAEFAAQSFSGNIHSDFGDSVRVSRGPGVMLEYRSGDNGAKIRLESFSGDISIKSR